MPHIEFLVEEPSAEAALQNIVPRIIAGGFTFQVHPFKGKPDLLKRLPDRLKGYAQWIPADWRIVVLIDEDRQNCKGLKARMNGEAKRAGLKTKSAAGGSGAFHVLNRIAVEELEAWFFGDPKAIAAAYPRVSPNLGAREPYRDPDAIKGGTWEALERVLQRAGHHLGGLEKIRAARDISRHMDPGRNRSKSFSVFRAGLLHLGV